MRRSPVAIRVLSAAVALCLGAAPVSAQILKRITDRAKEAAGRKVEDKVSQKVDEATAKLVDRSFDSVFGADTGKGGSRGGGASRSSSRLFAMLPNAPTEARYDFTALFTYAIESMPKGKPPSDPLELTMEFNREKSYAGARLSSLNKPREGAFHMIFDVPNESMVMLFESDTGKFAVAYSWKEAKRYAEAAPAPATSGVATTSVRPDAKPMQYTKLGPRKIAGYNTEGYRAEDENGIVDVWVANDPSLTYGRMMGATSSMQGLRGAMPDSYPVGMLMASETTDKKSGDKGRMTLTSADAKATVRIDMSQYPKLGASK